MALFSHFGCQTSHAISLFESFESKSLLEAHKFLSCMRNLVSKERNDKKNNNVFRLMIFFL